MCRNMVDTQSATAEIRQGKQERKKKESTGQKYNVRICYAGRPLRNNVVRTAVVHELTRSAHSAGVRLQFSRHRRVTFELHAAAKVAEFHRTFQRQEYVRS